MRYTKTKYNHVLTVFLLLMVMITLVYVRIKKSNKHIPCILECHYLDRWPKKITYALFRISIKEAPTTPNVYLSFR